MRRKTSGPAVCGSLPRRRPPSRWRRAAPMSEGAGGVPQGGARPSAPVIERPEGGGSMARAHTSGPRERMVSELLEALGSSLSLRVVLERAYPSLLRLVPADYGALGI